MLCSLNALRGRFCLLDTKIIAKQIHGSNKHLYFIFQAIISGKSPMFSPARLQEGKKDYRYDLL